MLEGEAAVAEEAVTTPAEGAAPPAPPAEQPEPTPAAPTAPLSRRDARAALAEDVKKHVAADPAAPAPDATKPADPAAPGDPAKPATEPAADAPKGIRVELPAGHALHGMNGVTGLTVSTPEEERLARALLNGSYVRVKENEELRAQLGQIRRENAAREGREAAEKKFRAAPSYAKAVEQYEELKESLGEEVANRFWAGTARDLEAIEAAEVKARLDAIDAEDDQKAAEAFTTEAWRRANTLPAFVTQLPVFKKCFEAAIAVFDAEAISGIHNDKIGNPDAQHTAFRSILAGVLAREKAVNEAYAAEQAKASNQTTAAANAAAEQARREKEIADRAVAEFKAKNAAPGRGGPPNPLGTVPATQGRLPNATAGQEEAAPAEQGAVDPRRAARGSIGGIVRRFTGG